MEGVGSISDNDNKSIDRNHSRSTSPRNQSDNIFNLKFSELPSSRYSYFLHGFKDEDDFEEFKKDLYNFKKLKQSCNNNSNNNNTNNYSDNDNSCSFGQDANNNKTPNDSDNELSDDLEIICRPNRTRRRTLCSQSSDISGSDNDGRCQVKAPSVPIQHNTACPSASKINTSSESLEVPSTCSDIPTRESPRLHRRSLSQRKFCLRPESFGLRGDFDRRSGLVGAGYDRRSGFHSSINDLLMEFIDGDEHFQEFERVYETINNKRRSRDLNSNSLGRMTSSSRTVSSPRLTGSGNQTTNENVYNYNGNCNNQPEILLSSSSVGDTFADFFDNDEDFLEFEKEFEKIRSNRLSRMFSSGSSFGSSKDIFGDLKAYCDRTSNRSNAGSLVSVSSCTSQGEAEPGCGADENNDDDLIWRSEQDWEKMLQKMRRNSRLVTEKKRRNGSNRDSNHRHSLYGLSKNSGVDDRYQKTQSLADLTVCCRGEGSHSPPPSTLTPSDDSDRLHDTGNDDSNNNNNDDNHTPSSKTADCVKQSYCKRKPFPPHQDSFSGFSGYDGDNSSVGDAWSDSCGGLYDDDVHYSSNSTLCSSHNHNDDDDNDLFLSLSCSCSSDLHIDEDTDEDFIFSSHDPSSPSTSCPQRSHSLMELSDRQREEKDRRRRKQPYLDPPFHSGSLINIPTNTNTHYREYPTSNLRCQTNPSSSSSTLSQSSTSDIASTCFCNVSKVGDNDHESLHQPQQISDYVLQRAQSECLESQTTNGSGSDTDGSSNKFHSAKSDFSDRFHSAKSDMPVALRSSGCRQCKEFRHCRISQPTTPDRSQSLNSVEGGGSCSCSRRSLVVNEVANGCSRVDEWLNQTAGHKHNDCQLTSHEHCVPSVTLDCITVSQNGGGGGGESAAHTPGPSGPSSEPTKPAPSLGHQLHTRPGCAKNVSANISDNTATPAATAASVIQHHQQQQQQEHKGPVPQYQQNTAPKLQVMSRTQSLPECHHHHPLQQQYHPHHQSQAAQAPNEGGNYHYQRHSSSPCLQGLPPPPSAIDQLTQGNDDARFITSSHHHQHTSTPLPGSSSSAASSQPPPTNQQTRSIPPIQECPPGPSPPPSRLSPPHAQSTPSNISHVSDTGGQTTSSLTGKLEPEAEEKDETDSGYRSGTIPDDKLPKVPSQATLDRQELKRKITKYNHFVPAASFEMTGKDSFQGFIKVTMNLIRPITMELGARPPSIYELLTREHIIEENTQQVAFYMPRDTHKSLHIDSVTTTRDVISSLLKKFHILDHPRKFAMYEQEFNDKNKLVRLKRLADKNQPLRAALEWDPERIKDYRMVLQENETGEIVWDAFSLPELGNFLKVLAREEKETIQELRHKYTYMRQIMEKRLAEFKNGKILAKSKSTDC